MKRRTCLLLLCLIGMFAEMSEAAREMLMRLCKAEYASILGRVSENSPTWLPQELLQAARRFSSTSGAHGVALAAWLTRGWSL